MKDLNNVLQSYLLNQKKYRKYVSLLTALSVLISFIVPFVLIERAESTTGKLTCNAYEHVHSSECTILECTEDHEHADGCHSLICTLFEHTHMQECFVAPTEEISDSTEEVVQSESDETLHSEEIVPEDEIKIMPELSVDEILLRNKLFMAFEVFNMKKASSSENDADSLFQAAPGAILGVATHFHIFAESVSLQSHVHGNIATDFLISCGAFGVYNNKLSGMDSTNYIKEFSENVSLENAYQTQLVLGDKYKYRLSGNKYIITDLETNKTYSIPVDKFGGSSIEYDPRIIIEEKNKPYINIEKELENFEELSKNIAKQDITEGARVDPGKDQNAPLRIDCKEAEDKYIYQIINADNLKMQGGNSMKEIRVSGLDSDQFLFLTIDLTGVDNAYFNKSWLVDKSNGPGTFGTGESPLSEGGCRVIYNFVKYDDEKQEFVPYDGKIVLGERRNGAILAPAASVNGAGNTNGTFICKEFVATGETHRLDIMKEGEEDTFTDWPLFEEDVEKINIKAIKKWSDIEINNHFSDTVTVQLYKGSSDNNFAEEVGAPVTIKRDSWEYTWTNLPKLDNAQNYYVKETSYYVSNGVNYTTSYNNNGVNSNNAEITITNTRPPINLTVKKEWVGGTGDQITVKLYQSKNADMSDKKQHESDITLNKDNNWTYTWNNLLSGYYYSVEETAIDGFTTNYSSNNGTNLNNQTIVITNTKDALKTKNISISVEKIWNDKENHSNDSVVVQLYQATRKDAPESEWTKVVVGNNEVTVTLDKNNNWKHTFNDILQYEDEENVIYYFVKEVSCTAQNGFSYTAAYDDDGVADSNNSNPIEITNTPQKMSISVKKYWSDGTSAHTTDSVNVRLYKSTQKDLNVNEADLETVGTFVGEKTLNVSNGWSAEWTNLDKGENIYYYVKEVSASLSNGSYSYEDSYSDNGKNNNAEINITNTQRMSVTVNKVWSDGDADNKAAVEIEIYKSFEIGLDVNADDFASKATPVKTLTFNKENKWTAVIVNLPIREPDVNDSNKEKLVYYYVKEKNVPQGYEASYSKNGVSSVNRDITVTNIKLTNITVTKKWIDKNNVVMTSGFPVSDIKFKLYRYKYIPSTKTNEKGELVPDEQAVEEFVKEGYKYRPTAAEVVGEYTITPNNNEWKTTIQNLPTEEEGYKIYYYIEEITVLDDYSTEYSEENLFYVPDSGDKTITNTQKKDNEFSLTVNKTWAGIEDYNGVEDYENPVQQWNKPISVVLKRSTDVNANWSDIAEYKRVEFTGSYTFTGLEMYVDNDESNGSYYYKIFEDPVNGYWTDYNNRLIDPNETTDGEASTEIINTHIKNSLKITKKWYPGQEPMGNEVSKVVVEIYRKISDVPKDINNSGSELGIGIENETASTWPLMFEFENNSTDNWYNYGSTITFNTDSYYSGESSIKVTGRTASYHGLKYTLDSSVFIPGNSYSFSAAVMQDSSFTKNIKLTLEYKDSSQKTCYQQIAAVNTKHGEWTKLENTSFEIPSDATDMYIYFEVNNDNSSDFYVDSIMLAEAGVESTVVTGQGRVFNIKKYLISSDFEDDTDGWSVHSNSNGTSVSLKSDNPFEGGKSLVVQGRTASWHGVEYTLDSSVFIPGNSYNFSGYVRQDSGNDKTIKITLQYVPSGDTNATQKQISVIETESGKWTKIEGNCEIPSGATNTLIYFETYNESETYTDFCIDNVTATAVVNNASFSLLKTGNSSSTLKKISNVFSSINLFDNFVLKKAADSDKEKIMELTPDTDDSIWNSEGANLLIDKTDSIWSDFKDDTLSKVEIVYASADDVYQGNVVRIFLNSNAQAEKSYSDNKVNYTYTDCSISEDTSIYGSFSDVTKVRKIIVYFGSGYKVTIYNTSYIGSASAQKAFSDVNDTGNSWLLSGSDHDWRYIFTGKKLDIVQIHYANEEIASKVFYPKYPAEYLSMWIGDSGGNDTDSGATTLNQQPNSKIQKDNLIEYDISNLNVVINTSVGEKEMSSENAYHIPITTFSKPEQVQKVILICEDGSSYIINNSSYSYTHTILSETKDMNLTDANAGFITLLDGRGSSNNNNFVWNDEKWKEFAGKELDYLEVNFNNNLDKIFQGGDTLPKDEELNIYLADNKSDVIYDGNTDSTANIEKTLELYSNQCVRYKYPDNLLIHTSYNDNKDLNNSLQLYTAKPEYIQNIVLVCKDGSTFTINNTHQHSEIEVLEKSMPLDFVGNATFNDDKFKLTLLDGYSGNSDWLAFQGRELSYIDVYYANDLSEVFGNSEFPDDSLINFYTTGNGTSAINKGRYLISNQQTRYSYPDNLILHTSYGTNINNDPNSVQLEIPDSNTLSFILKVVVGCKDGSTFTINNTTSIIKAEKKMEFKDLTDMNIDGDNVANALLRIEADAEWEKFKGKELAQITAYYPYRLTTGSINMAMYGNGSTNGRDGKLFSLSSSNDKKEYNFNIENTSLMIHESITYLNDANESITDSSDEKNILMMDFNDGAAQHVEKVVITCTDGSSYTIYNTAYNPDIELHKSDTIDIRNSTNLLDSGNQNFTGYNSKTLNYIEVVYGETLLALPADSLSINGTELSRVPSSDNQAAMKHTPTNGDFTNVTNLFLTEANDQHELTDIKEIILHYDDDSTYTIINTNHTPKVDDPPAVEDDANFNTGEFVFVTTVELTLANKWTVDLSVLPATDGQGNVYEYYIKEKSVYGTSAGEYTLLGYDHPEGIQLVNPDNNTGLTNGKIGQDGLIILPSTGGCGVTTYYYFGGALMLLGIAGFTGLKRRERKRRKE